MLARIVTVAAGGARQQGFFVLFCFYVSNIQDQKSLGRSCDRAVLFYIAGWCFRVIFIINHEPKIVACLGRRCAVNTPFSLRTTDSALVSSPCLRMCLMCVRDEGGGHREEACSGWRCQLINLHSSPRRVSFMLSLLPSCTRADREPRSNR